jgi:long-chain fatty acid transport protein
MKRTAVATFTKQPIGISLVLAFLVCEGAQATGFFINQQSVRGLGRVDAGNTVAADELGTIFFNPAGLTKVVQDPRKSKCIRVSVATHLIVPRGQQRNRGSAAATPGSFGAFVPVVGEDAHNPTGPTAVPVFYGAMPVLNNRAALGIGVNAPFGLTTVPGPDWHGRYDASDASLRTLNVSVVGAYRFDVGLSVGGGLDFQYARSVLTTAIPNPLAPGGPTTATDGRIQTRGHDYLTPGFNLGLLYDIDDESRIGFHYRSGMTHEIDGFSNVVGLQGPLAAFNGRVDAGAELKLPAIITAGVRTKVTEDVALFGEFEWFNWSTFDEVRIRFADGRPDGVRTANYRDAYAVAVGSDYTVTHRWTARGGVHFDTTPTVDSFRDTTVPDSDRIWIGLGATYEMSDAVSLDLAFNHVFFRDTRIALTRTFFDGTPLATTVNIASDVNTVVNTIAVDFRFRF